MNDDGTAKRRLLPTQLPAELLSCWTAVSPSLCLRSLTVTECGPAAAAPLCLGKPRPATATNVVVAAATLLGQFLSWSKSLHDNECFFERVNCQWDVMMCSNLFQKSNPQLHIQRRPGQPVQ